MWTKAGQGTGEDPDATAATGRAWLVRGMAAHAPRDTVEPVRLLAYPQPRRRFRK
ncbi:hypothetical protein ABZV14_44690 [Streptosporangium canum]|uniref:hypothetical protein n=1 Tax=Streptosporangium canum TaxID=324952 RepID=UPI0033BECDED